MLCESGWAGRPGLRVVCGGEGYGADLVRWLLDRVAEVWNFYGPDRGHRVVGVHPARTPTVTDPVPMGRPIANTTCYVLDEQRRPVPLGVAGELYLGGTGLARGYLGRPELTEERFVADPFAADPVPGCTAPATWSASGGTAPWSSSAAPTTRSSSGASASSSARSSRPSPPRPGIAQAVVIVREDQPGDRRLVAYVVGPRTSPSTAAALTDELRVQLPSYMVPSAIVALDRLPLTPNGKLDRKALPEPAGRQSSMDIGPPA